VLVEIAQMKMSGRRLVNGHRRLGIARSHVMVLHPKFGRRIAELAIALLHAPMPSLKEDAFSLRPFGRLHSSETCNTPTTVFFMGLQGLPDP
jgi:hypothetical protein